MKPRPSLIVHGGAGAAMRDAKRRDRMRAKISFILDEAYARLLERGALEASVFAVELLENDPDFNAGTGSRLQSDGEARLSASVMDGDARRFAGVINLRMTKNPVRVAERLLARADRVLAGEGALEFARAEGFKAEDPRTPDAVKRWRKAHGFADTVGACALDAGGKIACATSTGGKGNEMPGRVSDSATPAGTYAGGTCAVSATGTGEDIIDEGFAVRVVTRVEDGARLSAALAKTLREAKRAGRRIGAIGLDAAGRFAWGTTTESLVYGWRNAKQKGFF